MRGAAWTDERLKLLKELWAEGETADAIGARLGGLSRSAVLGKVFRLRLGGAEAGSASAPQKNAAANGKPRKARPPAKEHQAATARRARPAPKKDSPARRRRSRHWAEPPAVPRTGVKRRGKTLLELTNNSCRWVVEGAVKWCIGAVLAHFQ